MHTRSRAFDLGAATPSNTGRGICRMRCKLPPLSGNAETADRDAPWQSAAVPAALLSAAASARAPRRAERPPRSLPHRAEPVRFGGRSAGIASLACAACAAWAVVGCASGPQPATGLGAMRATPVLRIDHGAAVAERWYRTGKQALELGQVHWALLHFEQAAAAQPESADAHNGRVVALARLGRRDDAIALGRQLMASGLSSVELAGNLTVLEQQKRDMASSSAAASSLPLPRLVAPEPASSVADTTHGTSAAHALLPATPQSTLAWVQHAPQVLELTAAPLTVPVAQLLAEPKLSTAVPAITHPAAGRADAGVSAVARHVPMEISNGAGRSNLARTTAAALKNEPGVTVVRLTNHAHFRQQQTEIHYRGVGYAMTAQALAQRLSVPVTLVESQLLRKDVGLKLVLGADIVGHVADGRAPILPTLGLALANTR